MDHVDRPASLYQDQHVNTGSEYVPAPEAKTQPATVKERRAGGHTCEIFT